MKQHPESPEGMNLIADIVSANVSNLAATTDRVIQNLENEILTLSKLVMDIDDVFVGATVVDRVTESRYRRLLPRVHAAYETNERTAKSVEAWA